MFEKEAWRKRVYSGNDIVWYFRNSMEINDANAYKILLSKSFGGLEGSLKRSTIPTAVVLDG